MRSGLIYILLAALVICIGCGDDLPPYVAVWSMYQSPDFGALALHGVDGTSRVNVWAVGESGTIMHYDGSNWSNYGSSPTIEKLYDVTVNFDGSGWAVGASGTILVLNNGDWLVYPPICARDLYGVATDNLGNAWAVGDSGTVLRYDGSTWAAVDNGLTQEHLRGVSIAPDGRVVIVGDNGVILEFAGGVWSAPASPADNRLSSVDAAEDVYACGAADTILKRDLNDWVRIATSGVQDLNTVELLNGKTGFIGGIHGSLYEYSDSSWVPGTLPEGENIAVDVNDIVLIDDSNGWAVGNSGLILRYGVIY